MDYYSKYIELISLPNGYSANIVVTHLKSIFARHGIPLQIVSDNGPPFNSAIMKNFVVEWDIEHITTSPHFPQSNGQAESGVKIIKNILAKCHESNTDPYIALLHYRNSPKNKLPSPAQLLFSRQLRSNIPVLSSKLKPKVVKFNEYRRDIEKKQQKMKENFDKNCTELNPLRIGDPILYKKTPSGWWLSATVIGIDDKFPRSYRIKSTDGVEYRRNRRHIKLDRSRIQTSTKYESVLLNDKTDIEQPSTSHSCTRETSGSQVPSGEKEHQTDIPTSHGPGTYSSFGRRINKPKRFSFSEFDN